MIKNIPKIVGDKLPVMTYVEQEVFMKIEIMRGDVPRSRFLEKIIQKTVKEA